MSMILATSFFRARHHLVHLPDRLVHPFSPPGKYPRPPDENSNHFHPPPRRIQIHKHTNFNPAFDSRRFQIQIHVCGSWAREIQERIGTAPKPLYAHPGVSGAYLRCVSGVWRGVSVIAGWVCVSDIWHLCLSIHAEVCLYTQAYLELLAMCAIPPRSQLCLGDVLRPARPEFVGEPRCMPMWDAIYFSTARSAHLLQSMRPCMMPCSTRSKYGIPPQSTPPHHVCSV
ncbi:hypothetical protein BV22DRAFT_324058 [Leucogyrophana mollusca]|uniref:Uncharacterized protein n=1 Tax=Leucogyrophana mollusca TaxID=85980 RepID=A0ACB8BLQ8_9AGAM|nr:hypothetical protein BV22DRAFT_324058 [Leucogyrophana mollusca]